MACLSGAARVEKDLLETNPDPKLRAYIVWVPKTFAMERDVAGATARVMDPRARHYWDGGRKLMQGYQARLKMDEDSWDIYLLYGPGARWTGDTPPAPEFWMQQLGLANVPSWNPDQFAWVAGKMLEGR